MKSKYLDLTLGEHHGASLSLLLVYRPVSLALVCFVRCHAELGSIKLQTRLVRDIGHR